MTVRNLGISAKSLKMKADAKPKKIAKNLSSGYILGMKNLFEGASSLLTHGSCKFNPSYTNLTAAREQIPGQDSCT